ncbi:MAG: hypothetical protein AAGA48_00720 [Myxococcota bacterium]
MIAWFTGLLLGGCTLEEESPPMVGEELSETLFAVVVRIQGDGGSAVVLVDDLLAPIELDLSESLPLDGNGALFTTPFDPSALYVLAGDSPRITRYRIGADRSFTVEAELGLPLLTETRLFVGRNFQSIDETTAYLFDPAAGELRIWDPSAMELREIVMVPRDQVPRLGLLPVLGYETHRLGDEIYSTVGFASSVIDVVEPISLVFATNTVTGEISDVTQVQTCGYALHSRLTAEGELLLGTGSFSTAVGIASEGERAGESCVMAYDPVTRTSRETPVLSAADLFDGDPTGNFVFVADDKAWARVADPSALPEPPFATGDITSGPIWSWGFIDQFDPPSFRRVDARPPGNSFATPFVFDDTYYVVDNAPDFGGSQLLRLGTDGTLTEGISTNQTIRGIVRLGAAARHDASR